MADLEKRRFSALDGDYEVRRWFGRVKFRVEADAANLERLENGVLPFLLDHSWGRLIGNIIEVTFEDKKMWCVAEMSRGDVAVDTLRDIDDGLRKGISAGIYPIKVMLLEEDTEDHYNSLYEVIQWEPLECSSVTVPAITTVGMELSEEETAEEEEAAAEPSRELQLAAPWIKNEKRLEELVIELQRERMAPKEEEVGEEEMTMQQVEGQVETPEQPTDEEDGMSRIQELFAIGEQFNLQAESFKAAKDGMSVEDFRMHAMEEMQKRVASVNLPHQDAPFQRDLSNQLATRGSEYNFERMAMNLWGDGALQSEAAVEVKKSEELRETMSSGVMPQLMPAGGTPIPLDALVTDQFKRKLVKEGRIEELTVGRSDGTTGEDLSPMWTLYAFDRSPILSKVMMRTGLINDELIPELGAPTLVDGTDVTDPADADVSKTNTKLTPKQSSTTTKISLLSQIQTRGQHGSYLRETLAKAMVSKLQFDVEVGAAAAVSPTGARNAVAAADIAAYVRADLAVSDIHTAWQGVMEENADPESNICATVGTQLWWDLRRESLVTNGDPILELMSMWMGKLEGAEAFASTHMAVDELMIGPWAEVYMGMWGTPVLTFNRVQSQAGVTADLFFWRDVQSNRWDQFRGLHVA